MNAQTEVAAADNLRIWERLSKTDPRHTKQFKRAGGFSGTALKPIWIVKRLTEQFGPCGDGWGIDEPSFQIVPGFNNEVLVYCTVRCWHGSPDHAFYGVGGDKVVTHIKANEQYKRPERWENDDEAFKKAFTDAVNNAFKFVGVGADIHMGQFEDNKYVQETIHEFEEVERAEAVDVKIPGITKIRNNLNKLRRDGGKATDLETFNALVHDHAGDLQKIKDAEHTLWTGMGEDFDGFRKWIKTRREELTPAQESVSYQLLVSCLNECTSSNELSGFLAKHCDAIEMLDGEEGRRFETLYDEKAEALKLLAVATS